MSRMKLKVNGQELDFSSPPMGEKGSVQVQWGASQAGAVARSCEISWRVDESGIWIETPTGVKGFDWRREIDDDNRPQYVLIERNGAREFSLARVSRAGESEASATSSGKKKALKVKAQMPGKIVRVLVEEGQEVTKDQPLLVMEAMKMENEIRAVQSGRVQKVKATQGQAVETGAELLLIE